jgi:hypothetical protein
MPWWGTVILALGAAVVAGGAGLAGTVISAREARKQRELAAASARAERGGVVLAPILLFLDDIEPVRLSFNLSPATPQRMIELRRRWEQLREPLTAYAASHPSPAVLAKSAALITAVWNAYTSASYVVRGLTADMLPRSRDDVEPGRGADLETARADHKEARHAADELLALVRETDGATWRASLG